MVTQMDKGEIALINFPIIYLLAHPGLLLSLFGDQNQIIKRHIEIEVDQSNGSIHLVAKIDHHTGFNIL